MFLSTSHVFQHIQPNSVRQSATRFRNNVSVLLRICFASFRKTASKRDVTAALESAGVHETLEKLAMREHSHRRTGSWNERLRTSSFLRCSRRLWNRHWSVGGALTLRHLGGGGVCWQKITERHPRTHHVSHFSIGSAW